MEDYKDEIRNSRVGCLGSSDARMLAQIASAGLVPRSAEKRLAICKGLFENEDIPYTDAVRVGDEVEMAIYKSLKAQDDRWQSNVLWVSEKYSFENVKLITHPDFVLIDEKKKVINIGECKATKFTIEQTRETYKQQLYIHYLLGKELASRYGNGWRVNLSLWHYSTYGLDLSQPLIFDPSRLTIRKVVVNRNMQFDVMEAMNLVNDHLEHLTAYYAGDEVDANLLPDGIKSQFDKVSDILLEIKEREQRVEEFKERLYTFMVEKNIKSIKNERFSIIRFDPSESVSFDYKRYLEDMKEKHPKKAKKMIAEYSKTTKRKGYAQIKVRTEKN